MKTSLVIITSLLLPATSSYARIGETVKQVEARYGKPQKVFIDRADLRKVGYGYRGYMVMVYFSGGVSKRESFGRPNGPKMSRRIGNDLLRMAGPVGMRWEERAGDHGDIIWISQDKRVAANLNQDGEVFVVQDLHFRSSE